MVNERSSNRFLFIDPAGNRFVPRRVEKLWKLGAPRGEEIRSGNFRVHQRHGRSSRTGSDVGGTGCRGKVRVTRRATEHRVFISMLVCEIKPLEGIKSDRV